MSRLLNNYKRANVTPVFKKGDKKDPNNYRPISIIPVVGKVLEQIAYFQLMSFLQTNGILSPYQSGFRLNHSTEDVLVKTTDYWRRAVHKGRVVGVIFLDFKKAFDSVPHTLLLKKIESIGIRKPPLKWFRNFLSGRQQRVLIDGTSSDWLPIKCGVPQGSLLGPILFSLYINDLPSVFEVVNVDMYADDTAIYTDGPGGCCKMFNR